MNHRQKTHLSPCTRSHVGGWYDLTGGLPAMAMPLALYDAGGRADAEPVGAAIATLTTPAILTIRMIRMTLTWTFTR